MADQVDVLTIGESLGSLRTNRALQPGSLLGTSIAGAESNVAIGLSRLGHVAHWAGVVGRDAFGDLVLRTLRAEGVRTSARRAPESTGVILFTERLPGVTTVDYIRSGSAGSALRLSDLDSLFETSPRILHITGITPALSDTARETIQQSIAHARDAGVRVSFDINYRSRLWSREAAREVLAPIALLADIVIASDDELDLALDSPPSEPRAQIAELLEHASEVIVKHGSDGATGHTESGSIHEPARRIRSVDSVGAGDAFVAGYLSGTLDGLDLPSRLARGATLGAFAVASRGDWEGLPTRDELALLNLGGGDSVR